ncbi:hypothetical protein BDZ91DRAFT_681107 [Kalaharituber pfeilii]|nr:hypothetical protein BDZ91DRAFT_681107 [Kalaharituber pfeilii]
MNRLFTFFTFLSIAFTTQLASSLPSKQTHTLKPASCVYFLTNNDVNSVVAIKIDPATGMLMGEGIETPTGGRGMAALNAMTGEPLTGDTLLSQGAMVAHGRRLFAVNAGDNSLSMLAIDYRDCTRLKPMSTPAKIPNGEFPVAVAYSSKLRTACVALAGSKDGVSCFRANALSLQSLDCNPRPFSLNQTTPPAGPPGTVSGLSFNPSSSALLVTIKGNPGSTPAAPGVILRYPVNTATGLVGGAETVQRFSPPGTAILFGFSPVPGNDDVDTIVFTDPTVGAGIVKLPVEPKTPGTQDVDPTNLQLVQIPGQVATCWSTYSPTRNSFFVTDGGGSNLVEISIPDGQVLGNVNMTNPVNVGMLDATFHKSGFVYGLSPGENEVAVNVWDVRAGRGQIKGVQSFAVRGTGATSRSMGMVLV